MAKASLSKSATKSDKEDLFDNAPLSGAPSKTAFDPNNVKLARQLVFPTLKLEPGVRVFVKILEPMSLGRQMEDTDKQGIKRGPATLLKVEHLTEDSDSARNKVIVAPKLLQSALNENYPEASYVGKCFAITKGTQKKTGKNGEYNTFDVAEIKV